MICLNTSTNIVTIVCGESIKEDVATHRIPGHFLAYLISDAPWKKTATSMSPWCQNEVTNINSQQYILGIMLEVVRVVV